MADDYSYCILGMETVSDPLSKKYENNDTGMKKLTATVKLLVKPWFVGSGRTVIADSWFGSPDDMISMLNSIGLYGIMQVAKRRYWPRGMPITNVADQVNAALGSHFTMKQKTLDNRHILVCSQRDKKVKTLYCHVAPQEVRQCRS